MKVRLNQNAIDPSSIKPRAILGFCFVTMLIIIQLLASNSFSVYGQGLSDTDALIFMVNIERIRTQLLLTEENLDKGNSEMAFAHAFIPHSAIFPAIKDQLTQIEGEQSAKQLE